MTSKQKLYISTRLARQAVLDKDELDCLAFSVMCKLMFGCSVMKKATARQYKAMFRMGIARFKRILGNCLTRGYITEYDNHYKINPVKEEYFQNMIVELPLAWGHRDEKTTAVSLNRIKDFIRKVVQYHKFTQKEAIENALEAKANPKTYNQYRRANRLCSRISNNPSLSGKFRGTSIARVAKNTGVGRQKARRLLKEMVANGWLNNHPVNFKAPFPLEQFNQKALLPLKEMGWFGSYYRLGNDIYCRAANIYTVNGNSRLKFLR